jgi:uncharacterized repeat protein (TIGR03806 family)
MFFISHSTRHVPATIFLLAAFVLPTRADAPSTQPAPYPCHWADQPLTIDGVADEPAWRSAPVIDNFRLWWLPADKQTPYTTTKARLLWDRDYLYFFADMQDADLYANTTEHQGAMWEGDVFEVFFKPAADKPAYYEFEINPANATIELYLPSRNSGGWVKYAALSHIEMKTAVKLRGTLNKFDDKDEGWSVEGRIPWRDLAATGGRPAPGEQWLFTLCRVDTNEADKKTPHLSSSAPLTKPAYHRYEDYAPIRFVGPERADAHKPFGIESRPKWTSSKVVGSPDGPLPYTTTKAFPKLKVFQPVYILEEPGSDDCLLLQHLGSWSGPSKLLRFHNDPAVDSTETLLDIDALAYGMTLHPDFAHNGYIYIIHNGPVGSKNPLNRIVRYTIDRQPPYHIDPKSALTIIEWESNGHNGGDLAFGPDGYLYHAAGDGTSDSDGNLRGQDLTHITSALIRIDVDHPEGGKPYLVPKDNPFLNTPGARPEIFAYGFRNPWRLTFDRQTGAIWVGQNGQDLWESAYLVQKGANYGWSVYEGSHEFYLDRKRGPTPITFPTIEHPHSEMRSLTGGVVYRGSKFPDLDGAYLYGDWSTGRIFAAKHDGTKLLWDKELARTTLQITGFREMRNGDILIVETGGEIAKLVASPKSEISNLKFPTRLSDTGLFLSTNDHTPDPALIPYDVNSPLWSDGAAKQRFIAIPGDGVMEMAPTRGWNCPEGTVLVKTFSLGGRRVETRLITRQVGQWIGYTYRWNDQQSDADLVGAAGEDVPYMVDGQSQTWHFPSRAECMTCHSRAANFVLGLSTAQLNRDHDYGNGRIDNQLRVLEHLGMLKVDYAAHAKDLAKVQSASDAANRSFEGAPAHDASSLLPTTPQALPRLPDPSDPKVDIEQRARSYLHANCAICHVKEGGGNALMELEFFTPADKARIINSPPVHDTYGLPGARLVTPGHPESSVLLHRLNTRGRGQMPPLATSRVDEQAVRLLTEWIQQMPATAN